MQHEKLRRSGKIAHDRVQPALAEIAEVRRALYIRLTRILMPRGFRPTGERSMRIPISMQFRDSSRWSFLGTNRNEWTNSSTCLSGISTR